MPPVKMPYMIGKVEEELPYSLIVWKLTENENRLKKIYQVFPQNFGIVLMSADFKVAPKFYKIWYTHYFFNC